MGLFNSKSKAKKKARKAQAAAEDAAKTAQQRAYSATPGQVVGGPKAPLKRRVGQGNDGAMKVTKK